MNHPYLADVDFKAYGEKTLIAPYKPTLSDDPYDVSNFDNDFIEQRDFP